MLFNLAQTLRSLTTSPISTAINEAHRMAQRRLEAGGPAVAARGRVEHDSDARDFVLPSDVDPAEVAVAIAAKLRGGRGSAHERGNGGHSVLATRPDRGVVVPAEMVQRLGEGMVDRGRRILDRIVGDIRGRRVLRTMK
jgi:hypothetical protein